MCAVCLEYKVCREITFFVDVIGTLRPLLNRGTESSSNCVRYRVTHCAMLAAFHLSACSTHLQARSKVSVSTNKTRSFARSVLNLNLTNSKVILNCNNTRVVPQLRVLVSGVSPRRPGFAPRSVHVGLPVERFALQQAFLRVIWSFLSLSFHIFTHISSGGLKRVF
jgi:hypothetical protein